MDSNGLLKVSEFPNFNNTITYYVDSKYTLGNSDGSILRPYTTITSALSLIGSPIGNATTGTIDPTLINRYIIHINGGE